MDNGTNAVPKKIRVILVIRANPRFRQLQGLSIDQRPVQAEPSSERAQNRRLVQSVFQQSHFLLMLKQINGGFDNAIKGYIRFGKRNQ